MPKNDHGNIGYEEKPKKTKSEPNLQAALKEATQAVKADMNQGRSKSEPTRDREDHSMYRDKGGREAPQQKPVEHKPPMKGSRILDIRDMSGSLARFLKGNDYESNRGKTPLGKANSLLSEARAAIEKTSKKGDKMSTLMEVHKQVDNIVEKVGDKIKISSSETKQLKQDLQDGLIAERGSPNKQQGHARDKSYDNIDMKEAMKQLREDKEAMKQLREGDDYKPTAPSATPNVKQHRSSHDVGRA